jgi:eukaryotic-like serine/threonine-protein kinase
VMAAVQYAHQNLIVHRDLKPTNILVNKKGEVRLLDFGIAKLLQQENVSAAETELTRNSGRALTLRYAAPEQIEGKPITTATDVYALGLVLYELLTGASARDGKHHKKKSSRVTNEKTNTQAEREALTTDILRPSRGPIDKKIADARGHVTPAEIKSTLSGDLDTIVLKALAREPARRYPTISAFAADLTAWLERRPITARAPSFAYAMRMFVSRQRVPVGIAAFTVLMLVAAGGYSLKQRADMEMHRARSEEVQTFMANLLTAVEPEGVEDEKALTAKGLLDAGVERARFDYAKKPLMRGEMLAELAPVYMRLGERTTGEKLLREAIELIQQNAPPDEPSLHMARTHLGRQLLGIGEREQGIAMLTGVLAECAGNTATCRKARGSVHYYLSMDRALSTDQKIAHARAALELFIPGSDDRLQALVTSADLERWEGNFETSKLMLRQAEASIAERSAKLNERASLGIAKVRLAFDQGEYEEADALAKRMLALLNASKHGRNPLQFHLYRAHIANYQGMVKGALEQTSQVRKLTDPQKPNSTLAYALRYEARAYSMAGKHEQANQTIIEAHNVLQKIKANEKSQLWLDIARADAEAGARRGDWPRAQAQLKQMLAALRVSDPKNFRDHVSTLDLLGAVSLAMGDVKFALACHNEEIQLLAQHFAADHPLRLRAELQALLAKMQIEPSESQKESLAGLVQQLRKNFPEGSVHTEVLSKLVASEGSGSNSEVKQRQLVLIF